MPYTKELSEDLPSRIDLYKAGQGFISESLDVRVSTVRQPGMKNGKSSELLLLSLGAVLLTGRPREDAQQVEENPT